jgi:hypothetical protein
MKFCEDVSIWRKGLFIALLLLAMIGWPVIDHYEHLLDECKESKMVYLDHPDTIKLEKMGRLDVIPEENLLKGEEEMKKHKVVIVGITRDNAPDIQVMIKNIENIGNKFKDYRVILFENDSKDGTKKMLHSWWIKNKKVKVLSKSYNNLKTPNRKFISEMRNKYLATLESPEYKSFDIILALDMDMSYGIDVRGVEDSFSKIKDWDAVCSNGIFNAKGKMYDVFSFRDAEFPWTPTQWQEICTDKNNKNYNWHNLCKKGAKFQKDSAYSATFSNKLRSRNKLYWLLIVPQAQKIYLPGGDLIEVESCFGGAAFYKRKAIENCKYDSVNGDSEHVAFNTCIKKQNNGKIVMNPSQVIRHSNFYSN